MKRLEIEALLLLIFFIGGFAHVFAVSCLQMTLAQRLHLRLFLEGVEVPVISASVQSQPNAAAACTLQIPANDFAMQLKPRTLVHLFFYDLYNGTPPSDRAYVHEDAVRIQDRERDPDLRGYLPPERLDSTPAQDDVDAINRNYRLLFGGEVVGINLEKTPMNRSITLQCLDWSMYWDYAFQYQVSGFSLGGGGMQAAFSGSSTTLFNSFLEGNADIIAGLMKTAPRSYPKLKGTLLGALVHIIEAMGGIYYGKNQIKGVNDFFSLAELRLKLTCMVGANQEEQNSESRLMAANGFGSIFTRTLAGLGKQVSIRAILGALQRYIFHEIVPITSPHFIEGARDPNLAQYAETSIVNEPAYAKIIQVATRVKQQALQIKINQGRSTDAVTARNLSAGLSTTLNQLISLCGRTSGVARTIATNHRHGVVTGGTELAIETLFSVAVTSLQWIETNTRRGQRTDVRSNAYFLANTPSGQQVDAAAFRVQHLMQQIIDSKIRTQIMSGSQMPDPPPRLLTQIYRPDAWMVAPPRCNVIFPELYGSFSYGRSFMDEVTRLMLRTSEVFYGSDILFDGFFMSPSRELGVRTQRPIAAGKAGHIDQDISDAPAWFIKDMMDHELYTGIIPKFERMSDLNLHALRGGAGAHALDVDDGAGGTVKVGYAQLAANNIFFQYRFKTRQLNLQGKFNPYLALGFPALIIDKYKVDDLSDDAAAMRAVTTSSIVDRMREGEGVGIQTGLSPSDSLRQLKLETARINALTDELSQPQPNTHYLGSPAALSHSVSAEGGGSTSMQMTYARTTDERSEFLGDDRRMPKRYGRVRNAEVWTAVAMVEPPVIGPSSRGPKGGEIIGWTKITQEFARAHAGPNTRGRRATTQAINAALLPQARASQRASHAARYTSETRLPLFLPGASRSRRRGTRVRIGVEMPVASVPEYAASVGSVGATQAGYSSISPSQDDVSILDAQLADALGEMGPQVRTMMITFDAYKIKERLGIYKKTGINIPVEDLVFPPWYGESYRSKNIGTIYSYFFGTGSIVDPLTVFNRPKDGQSVITDGQDLSGASEVDENPPNLETDQKHLTTDEAYMNLPETAPSPVVDEPPAVITGEPGAIGLGAIELGTSIEDAVGELVKIYSLVRQNKFDVDDFLRSYTWRPIASMVDMFGTASLEIDDDGEVVRGIEGFHSRAYGDFDDLRQLTRTVGADRVRTVLGLVTTDADEAAEGAAATRAESDTAKARRLDTRKEKRLAVFRYVQGLLSSRGILG